MSEEEKKAIERLKKRIKDNEDYKTTQVWLTDDVVAVNTVLNLITKLQKENEKYKYLYQKALDNTVSADKENIQLKKQIDLMAKTIDELSEYYTRCREKNNEFCKEICIEEDIDCIDCIKQYFEIKAKGE